MPRADRNVQPLPSGVSFVQAAALGCRFTTAYRAVVQQGRLQPHLTLAVFGSGGVGLSCIMIAAALQVRTIIAVDVNSRALEKARTLGATHTIKAPISGTYDDNNEAVRQRIFQLTATNNEPQGSGAHVTIDAAGFRSTCENAISCTRRGG